MMFFHIESEVKGVHMKTIQEKVLPGQKFAAVSEGVTKYGPSVAIKSSNGHLGRVPMEMAEAFQEILRQEKAAILWWVVNGIVNPWYT